MCRVCQSCRVSIAATLFDMDGLLIDSEILWHKAEVEIFGSLGVPLFESSSRSTKGVFVNEVVEYWFARYPWERTEQRSGRRHAPRARRIARRIGGTTSTRSGSRDRSHE